jgi:hypothetical protein
MRDMMHEGGTRNRDQEWTKRKERKGERKIKEEGMRKKVD